MDRFNYNSNCTYKINGSEDEQRINYYRQVIYKTIFHNLLRWNIWRDKSMDYDDNLITDEEFDKYRKMCQFETFDMNKFTDYERNLFIEAAIRNIKDADRLLLKDYYLDDIADITGIDEEIYKDIIKKVGDTRPTYF